MPNRSIPQFLLTDGNFEALIKLLREKEILRHSIEVRDFGPRITDPKVAQRLLDRVVRCTREVLRLGSDHGDIPRLVLTNQLSQLPRQTLKSYLFFLPLTLILLFLGLQYSLTGTPLYIFIGTILFLLLIPLLLHRRTRIHVEHRCGYGKDDNGEGLIIIDQLPSIQFQSYLAHEYAHHIFAFQGKHVVAEERPWMREGWSRLLQWHVSNYFSLLEENPAYRYHVLEQVVGELKFACEMIASALQRRLPFKVRRTRTIYHRNPLFSLITGTPGAPVSPLVDHAIGTATYFLVAERRGPEAALRLKESSLIDGYLRE
jgi:hypothetical protein